MCRGSDSRAAGAAPAAAEQAAGLLRACSLPHGLQARAGAPRALHGQAGVATPDSPPLCCAAGTSRAPKCSARCRRAVWTSAGCVLAGKAAPSAGSRCFDSTHPHGACAEHAKRSPVPALCAAGARILVHLYMACYGCLRRALRSITEARRVALPQDGKTLAVFADCAADTRLVTVIDTDTDHPCGPC